VASFALGVIHSFDVGHLAVVPEYSSGLILLPFSTDSG
jgi:hypothetical protein